MADCCMFCRFTTYCSCWLLCFYCVFVLVDCCVCCCLLFCECSMMHETCSRCVVFVDCCISTDFFVLFVLWCHFTYFIVECNSVFELLCFNCCLLCSIVYVVLSFWLLFWIIACVLEILVVLLFCYCWSSLSILRFYDVMIMMIMMDDIW